MPEIPEIETIRMHLERQVKSQTIEQVIVNREKALNLDVQQFTGLVSHRRISDIKRRAKQIIISLSNQHSLVIHFMLEGYVRLFYANEEVAGKPTVVFSLKSGEQLAFFKLNLGYLHLVPTINLDLIYPN